ncbi:MULTISPECIES: divergent polysaccharide deacetylase family protein [unclassified Neptuniibacter]|uniref:divergent polysaccharide deacetylase family protein n=1 Tax=unclassified Neptuniibacter TaxID=2630693 RepID=UPI000C661611|nr:MULTISPECIES: divergent polysaccharide deacetylase family protein [unclassified Neptuniibacter]MAY42145.1 hypothetical protein [Oceanospirillaceae bacterium]|tara:strand:- start:20483 stop:21346 length:864 start_codon:yes stop_codon:yes gene_type:complete
MKGLIRTLLLSSALLMPYGMVSTAYADPRPVYGEQPVMAIVIDDIGDNRRKGLAAINLPGAITYAFLPHTPHSFELAKTAHHLGKEVILHAPMENKAGLRLGPGAMKDDHNDQQLNAILNGNLDSIPYVVGMNNHMGSLLTEKRQSMNAVMSVVQKRNMFFLDSVTTSNTVAWKAAHEHGIPYLVRDVFLDNRQQRAYIHKQFKEALTIAVTQGHAVVIGHPYPETVSYLEEVLPILKALGVRLVTASELLQMRSQTRLMLAEPKLEQNCDRDEGHCASLTVTAKHR